MGKKYQLKEAERLARIQTEQEALTSLFRWADNPEDPEIPKAEQDNAYRAKIAQIAREAGIPTGVVFRFVSTPDRVGEHQRQALLSAGVKLGALPENYNTLSVT